MQIITKSLNMRNGMKLSCNADISSLHGRSQGLELLNVLGMSFTNKKETSALQLNLTVRL